MKNVYIDVLLNDTKQNERVDIDELIARKLFEYDIFNYSKEVIKALVVLMRSNLIKRVKNSGYESQNYDDICVCSFKDVPQSKRDIISEAENETEGVIALCGEKAVDMYVTKCCGGGTANSEDILGRHIGYLRKVLCRYCSKEFYEDEVIFSKVKNKKINYKNEIKDIFSDVERDSTGRIISLSFLGSRMTGNEFADMLKLKSNRVLFKENSAALKVVGDGMGLGICLEGAENMAQNGKSYKEIINYYYMGVTFKTLNESDILEKLNQKKFVIDPGHGGSDFGNSSGGINEKDADFAISEILKRKLEAKGAEVLMTRNGDENITLSDRADIINTARPQFFISIHQNYFASPYVNGAECYYYDNDYESGKLAEIILCEVKNESGIKNRGAKKRDYYILKETKVRGIIIECMYISGNDDTNRLNTESYEKIAQAIYKGVCMYYEIRP